MGEVGKGGAYGSYEKDFRPWHLDVLFPLLRAVRSVPSTVVLVVLVDEVAEAVRCDGRGC